MMMGDEERFPGAVSAAGRMRRASIVGFVAALVPTSSRGQAGDAIAVCCRAQRLRSDG